MAFDLDWRPNGSNRVVQSHGIYVYSKFARKLERERDNAIEILRRLVQAKDEKEAHGESLVYRSLKAGLWGAARNAISPEND